MIDTPVNLLVEGYTDEIILHRLLAYAQLQRGITYRGDGKSVLLQRLPGYNQAAYRYPWVVVVDIGP